MRKITALIIALPLALGTASCGSSDSGKDAKTEAASPAADESSETPTEEPSPEPSPDPEGTYTDSCDYLLGDFSNYTKTGFRFVADAKVKNTGNIGTVNEVTATWFQAGGKKIVMTKTVRLEPGLQRRVGFPKLVGQDEIDLIQALNGGDQCKVKVTMVDTFGEPQA